MSTAIPAPPGLLPLTGARSAHARWSELNGEFLDHVERNPEYLSRDTFASLSGEPSLRTLSIQPWPIFLGGEQRRELERVALGMDGLVKGVLERFLKNDPARILEFYRIGESVDGRRAPMALPTDEFMLALLLEDPNGIRSAPSRADYIEDGEGLKCLEYNAGGFVGGYYSTTIGELYLSCPPIARFLEEKKVRARAPDTMAALFRYLVDQTVRMGAWGGEEFNVALVNRPNPEENVAKHPPEPLTRALRRVLEERGMPGGRVFTCGPEDLREERRSLFIGEHPVQLVMEQHDGTADLRMAFRLFKMGRINFISGPVGSILCDKRNLALISENAGSDEFTAGERTLIERHLPWTRMVRPGRTTFRGRGLRLPEDLADRRTEFVLKKATSLGGRHVRVGRLRTDAEWRQDLAQAVQEADWVVQEHVETVPYCFQAGEGEAALHDMVWGLLAFGDHFGGAYLRMQCRGGRGVVNVAQGAEVGVCLELEDGAGGHADPVPPTPRIRVPVSTLSAPEPLPVESTRPAHARWSELNGEFLDHVERNPEYLSRDTFASLSREPWLRSVTLQSWPLFLGVEQRRELERVALGMDGLVKGAMERFLKSDPSRILDFYRVEGSMRGRRGPLAFEPNEFMLALILEEPNGIRSIPTRADYLESPDGLKCLEYNAGFLGATQLDGIGEVYLACPPIARFLEEKKVRARAPDTLTAGFRHLVDETVRMGVWGGGEFNAAVLLWPNNEDNAAMFVEEMYSRALRRALQERGMPGGRVFFCGMEDFRQERSSLFVGEHPVQLVMEHHDGTADQRLLFRLFKMGRLNLVSGPMGYILGDKRNLALISENAGSDEFTAGERTLIERHLPWTRMVRPGRTTFRGRGLRLPEDLADRRAEFVLKKGSSLGGRYVRVGRFRTDAEWRQDLAQAVQEADWIVQEYLETVPYCFQAGERGAVRHDMVWGLFAFGDHFGGALLRMQPCGGGTGVVNSEQGAQLGLFLELEDESAGGAGSPHAPSPLEEARPVHARWSELNGEFLDHVERNPEYLSRDTFASLSGEPTLRKLSIQPWPLFLGGEQYREVEHVALGIDRLVKGVLERFMGNDPARIVEFYRANEGLDGSTPFVSHMSEFILTMLLEEPDGIRSAPSRADYMEDREGLKCLEYNAGSFLGGFHATPIGEVYLACPPIARFLEEKKVRARAPDTVAALFRHLVDETVRMGAWGGGDFNVALVSRPHEPARVIMHPDKMYDPPLRRVLAERGMGGGRFFSCGLEDFREERRSLFIGEHPIHLVIEHHDGTADLRSLFRLFKMGRINFISGPIGDILSDKRNLALLSENVRSDEFTAGERTLIERYLPWTRTVRPGRTTFRGRGLRLPDDLADRRAEFVLKKATSLGGRHVHVGRFRTDAEWRQDLAQAVQEGDWVVQEYLEPLPYCFQAGERGAVRHDMVWGLFAFGDHFGGAFLRMQRRSGTGVVNTRQGAEVGVFLELPD